MKDIARQRRCRRSTASRSKEARRCAARPTSEPRHHKQRMRLQRWLGPRIHTHTHTLCDTQYRERGRSCRRAFFADALPFAVALPLVAAPPFFEGMAMLPTARARPTRWRDKRPRRRSGKNACDASGTLREKTNAARTLIDRPGGQTALAQERPDFAQRTQAREAWPRTQPGRGCTRNKTDLALLQGAFMRSLWIFSSCVCPGLPPIRQPQSPLSCHMQLD